MIQPKFQVSSVRTATSEPLNFSWIPNEILIKIRGNEIENEIKSYLKNVLFEKVLYLNLYHIARRFRWTGIETDLVDSKGCWSAMNVCTSRCFWFRNILCLAYYLIDSIYINVIKIQQVCIVSGSIKTLRWNPKSSKSIHKPEYKIRLQIKMICSTS